MKAFVTLAVVATLLASVPAAIYLAPHVKAQATAFGEVGAYLQQRISAELPTLDAAVSIAAHGKQSTAAQGDGQQASHNESAKAQADVHAEGALQLGGGQEVQQREAFQSRTRVRVTGQREGTFQLGTGDSETHTQADTESHLQLKLDLSGLKLLLSGGIQGELEGGTR